MPIYEYTCMKCGHAFEALARHKNDLAKECPKCGAKKVKKQFSVFAAAAGKSHEHSPCASGTCPSAGTCSSGTCPYN